VGTQWLTLPGGPCTREFAGSAAHWEARYAGGGHSGVGSRGRCAEFKAEVLNALVAEAGVQSVVEFGCGDGAQLALAEYPAYLGLDVSATALELCRARFAGDATRRFALLADYAGQQADLALSLDVVYHLVEDDAFEAHLRAVFAAATRYVVIYSSDFDDHHGTPAHIRHRHFTWWVARHIGGWRLEQQVPNRYPWPEYADGSLADFYIYARDPDAGSWAE